ncbi:MAG TPA: hypothetical protein VF096_10215 [Azonexus sp.]
MNSSMVRIGALGAMLFSGGASAIGLGDIILHSRIGEPLRAEVPIFVSSGETLDGACFSLATIRGADLPVISSARFRLDRSGPTARLTITGTQPIAEPVFVIGLRAHCGIELQRDYVLMPSPPVHLAEAAPASRTVAAPPATTKKARNYREWTARQGDTLESIAEAQAGTNLAEQQRLLQAMKRANPDLAEYQPLAEGSVIRIPSFVRRPAETAMAAETPLAKPRPPANDLPPPPKKPKPKAPPPPAVAAGSGPDRVMLGAAPDEVRPEPKAVPARAAAGEVEERMLKLETTLQQLNQEVEKLNSALALATEALAVQQKLMTAQSQQNPPAAAPAVRATAPAPATPAESNRGNWLELLLSALVGGGIAAGLAHFLSRRPARNGSDELPLSIVTRPHHSVPASVPPPPPVTVPAVAAAAPAAIDIPFDESRSPLRAESVAVDFNDGNSALELAEIMLSFGRVKGAAETLAMHIAETAPNNIQPWTMLLDLYRRGDMRTEFEALATQMRGKFNLRVPQWTDSTTPVSGLKSLEDYAHIVWRITNCWGEQECMDHLYELVHDNRAGNRAGFPLEVVEEIVLLMHVLETGHGLHRPGA